MDVFSFHMYILVHSLARRIISHTYIRFVLFHFLFIACVVSSFISRVCFAVSFTVCFLLCMRVWTCAYAHMVWSRTLVHRALCAEHFSMEMKYCIHNTHMRKEKRMLECTFQFENISCIKYYFPACFRCKVHCLT